MDFEVVYSATLERAGHCRGLSSYIGQSVLYSATQERDAPDKIKALQAQARKVFNGPRPLYGEVLDRMRRGYTLRSTALHYKMPVGVLRNIIKTGERHQSIKVRKPAAWKLPLEAA
jgi:hypothetical protein